MASFNKFNLFVQDMGEGKHDFASSGGTYKVMLTNTAPVATNHVYSDISGNELTTGGGYTAGGATAAMSDANSSGTETVSCSAGVSWTGSDSGFGPFRYAVLYGGNASNTGLVGWWDYGSSISVTSGNTFAITFGSGVYTNA